MSDTAFLALLVITFGAAVGSFAALLADRLPRGEDVVRQPSHCDHCRAPLAWRDKLPILSYLLRNGQCRACGGAIPRRLFYAEILGAGLGIIAVVVAQSPLHMLIGAAYLWCLMALALCDVSAFRLPDALTGLLFGLGLALAWEDPARTVPGAVLAAAAGVAAFWGIRMIYQYLRQREGLGLGDVKLAAGIAAGVGAQALPYVALVAAMAALAVTLGQAWRTRQPLSPTLALPFGAYLAAATTVVWAVKACCM